MLTVEVNETSPWFENRSTHEAVYQFISDSAVEDSSDIAKHFGVSVRNIDNALRDLEMAGFVVRNDDDHLVTLPLDATRLQVVLRG